MNNNLGFTDEEIDVLLPFLVNEGYLKKQKMKNGKVWYKRTNKKIPQMVCPECNCSNYMHYGYCSQALIT